ncbi:MAG: hypothetical protein WBV90_03245 [Terrimicrobiaceae bacterium]
MSTRDQLGRWLRDGSPDLQWIQVEGLLDDPDAWALAAQGEGDIPLDVVLSEPGGEFADLYRLVDVCGVREVRLSMPAAPGFLKALRLAASLALPVRLLPGQPSDVVVRELAEALSFYLHDSMVEAPIEFFHSTLAWMRGTESDSMWNICEQNPAIFDRSLASLSPATPGAKERRLPGDFVPRHLQRLIDEGAECAACPWQPLCQGYFKWPDPSYSCQGVKQLFSTLRAAADEIGQDLTRFERSTQYLTATTHGE